MFWFFKVSGLVAPADDKKRNPDGNYAFKRKPGCKYEAVSRSTRIRTKDLTVRTVGCVVFSKNPSFSLPNDHIRFMCFCVEKISCFHFARCNWSLSF